MKRLGGLLGIAFLLVGTVLGVASAQTETAAPIVHLEATGVVDPFLADYLVSGIEQANEDEAAGVLITIDTPGGLSSSTRDITQAILNSEVPVITYVAPSGARAASAGTYLLMAGSVAAMAPGTNVGAAHPVGISGAIPQEKATNDAAASLVSIAETRGRSTEFAEAAVVDSLSISAEQALEDDVIDLVAPDTQTLLTDIDGMQVPVADGTATLATADAPVVEESMSWFFGFLHALLSPDIAFLFFWLGLIFVILEFFIPGGVLGGVGGLMLLASVVAIGMLPVQLLGLAFLVAAVILLLIELQAPGLGIPAIAGVLCLVAGGLTLFDPDVPNAQVSPWVIFIVAALVIGFFGFAIQAALRMRNRPVANSMDLAGQVGVVLTRIDPEGTIRVGAEEWTAELPDGADAIPLGEKVRVRQVKGLRLLVEPLAASDAEPPKESVNEGGGI